MDSHTINGNDLVEALTDRGVNPELAVPLLVGLIAPVLERTLAWYDAQHGRVGPGVLVAELRRGGTPARERPSMLDEQRAYGEQVIAWLREHFPEWNKDEGDRTHPAAAAAVIRLHHRHGKHALSAREHGAEIRRAVAEFDARYGLTADEEAR